ncbi:MAG TPA: hypothetical protein VEL47_06670 [Myxococcota bacterium]|nr:hypothetical protein [Myxococcota bacterium]
MSILSSFRGYNQLFNILSLLVFATLLLLSGNLRSADSKGPAGHETDTPLVDDFITKLNGNAEFAVRYEEYNLEYVCALLMAMKRTPHTKKATISFGPSHGPYEKKKNWIHGVISEPYLKEFNIDYEEAYGRSRRYVITRRFIEPSRVDYFSNKMQGKTELILEMDGNNTEEMLALVKAFSQVTEIQKVTINSALINDVGLLVDTIKAVFPDLNCSHGYCRAEQTRWRYTITKKVIK